MQFIYGIFNKSIHENPFKLQKTGASWVAPSAKRLTLDRSSGHDLGAMGLIPTSASTLIMEAA